MESGGQGGVIQWAYWRAVGEGRRRAEMPWTDTIERCSRALAHVCLALTFTGPWDWQSHISDPWGAMEDHESL